MLADLAHEMRTPLATLEAHLEALQDGVRELDEATFDVLAGSTQRLRRLADDVGAVSRAQEGELEIQLEPSDPGDLVEAATGACADRYRDAGVALSTDLGAGATVLVDPARMGQVLANLLDNALRHTPAGGTVQVSCRRADRGVEIEVADSGEGIEPAHLSHVFDRFYRADPARNSTDGGSGIGLTISKALVEAQGGELTAHSDGPGRGATFTVRLPGIQETR
jgi:signal transduction histidine kinase